LFELHRWRVRPTSRGGGLEKQGNDLVIIREEAIASALVARFEVI
jgi:hypothetical protein